MTIRVMLADDHTVLRDGVRVILDLEDDIDVVAEAGDGDEALERYRDTSPDVLVLDLHMPGIHDAELIEQLRAHDPEARILILTTYGGGDDIQRSLKAGARGYLLKDTPRTELVDAIRRVAKGERVVPPSIAATLVDQVDAPKLTPRELEVLRQVAEGKSNTAIAKSLFVSEATVKSHVNSILTKLGVRGRTEAVTTAIRRGLVRV